jgi:hypothetical protein
MGVPDTIEEAADSGRFARTLVGVRTGIRTAIDLVLPPTCLSCRKPVGAAGGLCPSCWSGMGFIERP